MVLGLVLAFGPGAQGMAWAQSQPTVADASITSDTIVAVVDEKPITLGELIVLRQSLPQAFQVLPDEVLLESLIQMIVDEQILANAAEAASLQRSKRANYVLKNTTRKVLADVFVANSVRTGITEERIEAIYAEKFINVDPVPQVRAAHILVDNEAVAKDVRQKLDEGVDFATLAAKYSTDLTNTRGGDLGWQETADLLPAFAAALAEMEPGQINGPVESAFGWHIIRLDEWRTRPVPPLEEIRESLKSELESEIREAAISSAKAAASIKMQTDAVPAGAIRDDALILP